MKNFIYCILSIMMISSCSDNTSFKDEKEVKIEKRESHDICITSWNTFLLDTPLSADGPLNFGPQCEGENCRRRAQAICERLLFNGGDVFMLQEVWEDIAIETLNECLTSAGFQVVFDKDSGLMTAVRNDIPISDVIFEEFDDETGLDLLKAKGFLSLMIELEDGCSLNLINTHLNAGDNDRIRRSQLSQISSFVRNGDQTIPVIVGGDFNIPLNSSEYSQAFDSYLSTDFTSFVEIGDVSITRTNDTEFIDYFLFAKTRFENVIDLVGNFIDQECQWTVTNQYSGESFTTTSRTEMERFKAQGYIVGVDWCRSGFSDHKPIEMCFTYDCDGEDYSEDPEFDPDGECYCDCVDRISGESQELYLSSCVEDCSHYSFFDCEKKQR